MALTNGAVDVGVDVGRGIEVAVGGGVGAGVATGVGGDVATGVGGDVATGVGGVVAAGVVMTVVGDGVGLATAGDWDDNGGRLPVAWPLHPVSTHVTTSASTYRSMSSSAPRNPVGA